MTDTTRGRLAHLRQVVQNRHDDWRRYRQVWQYIYYALGGFSLLTSVAVVALTQTEAVPRWGLTIVASISTFTSACLAFYKPWAKYAGYLRAEVILKRSIDICPGKKENEAISLLETTLDEAYEVVTEYRIETREETIKQLAEHT